MSDYVPIGTLMPYTGDTNPPGWINGGDWVRKREHPEAYALLRRWQRRRDRLLRRVRLPESIAITPPLRMGASTDLPAVEVRYILKVGGEVRPWLT